MWLDKPLIPYSTCKGVSTIIQHLPPPSAPIQYIFFYIYDIIWHHLHNLEICFSAAVSARALTTGQTKGWRSKFFFLARGRVRVWARACTRLGTRLDHASPGSWHAIFDLWPWTGHDCLPRILQHSACVNICSPGEEVPAVLSACGCRVSNSCTCAATEE